MIYLSMIFMHILDDYCLQGILASMKQKEWWKKNEQYKELYKYDYIIALIMHSFSWSFMVMLPIVIATQWSVSGLFMGLFFTNVIIHSFVDDLKANKGKINLWVDQIIHLIQIIITATILM